MVVGRWSLDACYSAGNSLNTKAIDLFSNSELPTTNHLNQARLGHDLSCLQDNDPHSATSIGDRHGRRFLLILGQGG
jgi:hypothetical protein